MQQDAAATARWDTSYEWKIILVLSLTFGLVGLDRFILPVLFPSFMGELGLTYEDLGNLVGILAVFWGLSAFAMGFLSGRVGRRKVLIPAVIWVFWSGSTGWGVALLVWSVIVGTMDNVLRPLLIRRGADLPLLLIFAGVIGGLIAFGIIGLFVGPVVLAVAYTLLTQWLAEEPGT